MSRNYAPYADLVADVISDAGGKLIGRVRLQKTIYLLSMTGLIGDDIRDLFRYKHYGPYSDVIADAANHGRVLGYYKEEEKQADWGGFYSIYTIRDERPERGSETSQKRTAFTQCASQSNAVALELLATAVFLAAEGEENPWKETERLKPHKVTPEHYELAKELYEQLNAIKTPKKLPEFLSEIFSEEPKLI